MVFILIFVTCICFLYINVTYNESVYTSNTQCVVFLDKDSNLIPITVDVSYHNTLMNMVYNKINIMKSNDFTNRGLFPVYDSSLEILDIDISDLNVRMHLYIDDDKKINMRMLESLCFILNDVDDEFNLDVIFHKNNKMESPVIKTYNNLNKNIGLNNFVDESHYIHESIPVQIYKDKYIDNIKYYVPFTYRINNKNLNKNVEFVLKEIDEGIILKNVNVDNNILTIHLDNNILNDNEKIDLNLETKIVLSLMTLSKYDNIVLMIDGVNVRNNNDANMVINYFYLS